MKRIGTIIVPPGAFIDVHEKIVVDFLAIKLGLNITFLVPNRKRAKDTRYRDGWSPLGD